MQKPEQRLALEPYRGPHAELVPMSDHRAAWNTIHQTDLPEHNNALTEKQRDRINGNFDIEIHLGAHGQAGREDLMTQGEYAAAAAVVEGMKPGDVLFQEIYGHDVSELEPVSVLEPLDTDSTSNPALQQFYNLLNQHATGMIERQKSQIERARAELEHLKDNYLISAWSYAAGLARLKGVKVVHADLDAFDRQVATDVAGGKGLVELSNSIKGEESELAARIHTNRELAARNIMKDYALKHLPHEQYKPIGRKPKLVLLYGALHGPGLRDAFDDMGLKADIHGMDTSGAMALLGEQINRAAAAAIPNLIGEFMLKGSAKGSKDSGLGVAQNKVDSGLAKFSADAMKRRRYSGFQ
ncbi:MAG TPA: hypothetical protein VF733_02580 [Candidatus Saccharimonadales bacterium]